MEAQGALVMRGGMFYNTCMGLVGGGGGGEYSLIN
jgi:hypothetical protein